MRRLLSVSLLMMLLVVSGLPARSSRPSSFISYPASSFEGDWIGKTAGYTIVVRIGSDNDIRMKRIDNKDNSVFYYQIKDVRPSGNQAWLLTFDEYVADRERKFLYNDDYSLAKVTYTIKYRDEILLSYQNGHMVIKDKSSANRINYKWEVENYKKSKDSELEREINSRSPDKSYTSPYAFMDNLLLYKDGDNW